MPAGALKLPARRKKDMTLSKLSATQLEILGALRVMQTWSHGGDLGPTAPNLARMFSLSPKTVSRHLKVLENAGFVTQVSDNYRLSK